MNIFNLLTTKGDVSYLTDNMTISDALADLNEHGYTAVPVIGQSGEYINTVTEGDFLRYIYNSGFNTGALSDSLLCDMPIRREILPVHVNAKLDDLVNCAKTQNFVPVVDDRGIFIGIVTRKDLIIYACSHIIPAE